MNDNEFVRKWMKFAAISIVLTLILIFILEGLFMAKSGTVYIDPFEYMQTEVVDVTVYSPRVRETDNFPLQTASGFLIDTCIKPQVVSVSRDLLDCFPYGSIIEISQPEINSLYGKYFVVLDCMNARFEKRIDILVINHKKLHKWHDVHITKL